MSDDQAVTGPGMQTRRALLAGAGAVGASVVLAACGTGDDAAGNDTPTTNAPTSNAPANDAPTTNAPASPGAASEPAGSNGGAEALAKTSDIPVGGGKIIAAQEVVVTQPTAGEYKAFSAICTHQRCLLANVDGGTINCTCHGSRFAIKDGSVKNGPATRKLTEKKVTVDGENIVLA